MKTLIILSLVAAFASPAIANVVPSTEPGKPHCAIMEAKLKHERELQNQAQAAAAGQAGKAN